MRPDPPDEQRHLPTGESTWCETFDLTFHSPLATFGGFITLVLWPVLGQCWYWTSVVQENEPLVTLLETDIDLPRAGLELRAQGLWADHNCEMPFEHWSYGLEAFALRLDDPDEALRGFRGDRIGLGYDLEWEASSEGPVPEADGGYRHEGLVHGEVLVGETAFDLDGRGWRRHRWGAGSPWPGSSSNDVSVVETAAIVGRAVASLPFANAPAVVERRLQRADTGPVWTLAVWPADAGPG